MTILRHGIPQLREWFAPLSRESPEFGGGSGEPIPQVDSKLGSYLLDSNIKVECRDCGGEAVNTMFMYVDEDGRQARKLAVPIIERATGTSFDPDSGHYLVGSYQECLVLLERWVKAGAKQICVWPVIHPAEQIRRFGEHVLPKVAKART